MSNIEVIEENTLCRGRRIKLVQKIYKLGEEIVVKDVVKFGQGVAIVPIKNNKIIMIKQFRAPIGRWILEIPAGKVEPGENIEEAAKRELKEETGYEANELKKIASVYLAPGYSDEVLHIYLAKNLIYTKPLPEKGELIEVVEVEFDEILNFLLNNEIVDAKTLLSLMIIKHMIQN